VIGLLRPHAQGRARIPDRDAVGRAGHAALTVLICTSSSPRASSRSRIPASSRASRRRSADHRLRAPWRQKQQELAKVILADPAVESLSSFIGADGTNTTRQQRPHVDQSEAAEERSGSASDVIRRLNSEAGARSRDIQLFMEPVQNITVDDRVSRTQYQYTLEDPDAGRAEPVDQPLRRIV
jgi:hypothetical protein